MELLYYAKNQAFRCIILQKRMFFKFRQTVILITYTQMTQHTYFQFFTLNFQKDSL
ncbi:hypothetical protein CCAND38_100008 [Capnocytophaga canis]|uniref:Uncharacterized protein n=1 Tax=Capnocytophaga canis TaxID=1848903 RepID=A0A0B7IK14_9FLAO|nr:hypothetical protein CCAND38_100008 [Capnocytophaga canis]CEN52230.1 hypothetical protein CCAND93_220048 [Capnocytophaga canis]